MKRKRRTIQDDFPTGSLDRAELQRVFGELREKRLARERRQAMRVAADRDQSPSATAEGTQEPNRAA